MARTSRSAVAILVLHRLVFLVRLHRHELVLVAAQPGLHGGHVLFDLAPAALALLEPGLDGGEGLLLGVNPLVEGGELGGHGGDGGLGAGRFGLELLEVDEVIEVGMHATQMKKAPQVRSLLMLKRVAGRAAARKALLSCPSRMSSILPRCEGGGPTRIRTWDRPVMSRRL